MFEIETERLYLRNWKLSDSSDVYEYAGSELVGPNAGWNPHRSEQESLEILKMFLREDETLAVELKSEGKVIGSVGLHNRRPDENLSNLNQREIGYVLNPLYWGNGYIPEAVEGLLEIGFIKMKLDLIWCGHFEENYRSKRVNEKCGFHFQFAKERNLTLLDNRTVITWYYNLKKEEYLSRQTS